MTNPANSDAVATLKVDIPIEGGELQAVLSQPKAPGSYPALVIGTEAWGVTEFVIAVGQRLAAEGFVCVIPDFLRGEGLPEDQHDLDRVGALIDRLDFRRATDDPFAAAAYLRNLANVAASRVGTWATVPAGPCPCCLRA